MRQMLKMSACSSLSMDKNTEHDMFFVHIFVFELSHGCLKLEKIWMNSFFYMKSTSQPYIACGGKIVTGWVNWISDRLCGPQLTLSQYVQPNSQFGEQSSRSNTSGYCGIVGVLAHQPTVIKIVVFTLKINWSWLSHKYSYMDSNWRLYM